VNLEKHIESQRVWSKRTFGDGPRTEGILKHIEAEMREVREHPEDLFEWIDIVILALDGAWRAGHSPYDIALALQTKMLKNINRTWPKPVSQDEPVMHIKEQPNEV